MRNRRLFDLYSRNARKGAALRADAGGDAGDNTIWLYDVIVGSDEEALWWGGVSPEAFARSLRAMSGPVTLRINSPGGDVFAGIAIAQAVREYADGVTVRIDGLAASIASIIAIAGAEVVAAPGAFVMVHKAWTLMFGNADDLLAEAALLDKIDGSLADQYRAKAGDSTDWAAAMTGAGAADGTWFTADEAVAAGLIDRVESATAAPAARVAWDLSAYAGAPAAAPQPLPQAEPVTVPVVDTASQIATRQRRLDVALRLKAA